MNASALTVLLIEPHPLLRQHIRHFLQSADDADLAVADIAGLCDLDAGTEAALRPHVVLLGANSDVRPACGAIPGLRGRFPEAAIIVLGLLDGDAHRRATLAAGADAFLAKDALLASLLQTIRQVIGAQPQESLP